MVDYRIFHCTIVNTHLHIYYGSELMMTNPWLEKISAASAISTPHTYTPKNVVFAITKSGEGEKKKEGCVFLP